MALFATASSYRLGLRLLEKRLSPATAALVATGSYSTAAAAAGILGYARLRKVPLPLPTETVREKIGAAAEADSRSQQEQRRGERS
jgi:hypothetical protein